MLDRPTRTWRNELEIHHHFETVAMAYTKADSAEYPRKGEILGVLTWGYTVTGDGEVALDQARATEKPSEDWKDVRQKWNYENLVKIPEPV